MGTQAHWFSSHWRAAEADKGGFCEPGSWRYADTLRDVREEFAHGVALIQRRTGRKGDYTYKPYGEIRDGKVSRYDH